MLRTKRFRLSRSKREGRQCAARSRKAGSGLSRAVLYGLLLAIAACAFRRIVQGQMSISVSVAGKRVYSASIASPNPKIDAAKPLEDGIQKNNRPV